LRKLFGYVAGPDIDERIRTTVDNLAEVYRATNVEQLLQNFGASTQQHDPIIHFYETFLAAYDPKLRKSRGVWYTPEPVVKFIVRAVDDILKTEFGLPQGLADTSKTKIKLNTQTPDKRSKTGYKQIEKEVHKVQILDPATGTGTFLAEVIKHIYRTRFQAMQGAWSGYVEEHLIPRLNGFELLMASYAMAHLKLDMLLTETGYRSTKNQRFNVFLTNALEEYHPDTGTLFSNWLSTEANEANFIKRDKPVMCIIGNPPYSSSSNNKGKWISKLTEVYKNGLNERTVNSLSDDYIKFIRFSEHYIIKNGEGILAFITNNSFLDGVNHRVMRSKLLNTFNKVFILNLHGDTKKKEVTQDGKKDQNVFDIMQGVSINIFVKTNNQAIDTDRKYISLLGLREDKYDFLNTSNLYSMKWDIIEIDQSDFQLKVRDVAKKKEYESGIALNDLFINYGTGVETGKDSIFTSNDKYDFHSNLQNFNASIEQRFSIKDTKGFMLLSRLKEMNFDETNIKKYNFKPLDYRYCYYDEKLLRRASFKIQKHIIYGDNTALLSKRGRLLGSGGSFHHISITNTITDKNYLADQSYLFPLYVYNSSSNIFDSGERHNNLKSGLVQQIADGLQLTFTPEKEADENTFAPIDLLDYIYAVLHSPSYRETYKEFLKIDFPRVPYPKDAATFWELVALGGELRQLHLLESPKVEQFITSYPKDGDNSITTTIGKKDWELFDADQQLGRIWINEDQYFDDIPLTAWEFYIGGYQPAQKWLKDRKQRTLSFEDILHYQKIIVALMETDRLMQAIDAVELG
jgi:predicted helicase